jgi:hypothetical protein
MSVQLTYELQLPLVLLQGNFLLLDGPRQMKVARDSLPRILRGVGRVCLHGPSNSSHAYYPFLTDLGTEHSIGLPIHVYPLYENGFRAHRNQSIQENNNKSARMYAQFAKVAEKNPFAWNYGKPAATKETIRTVSKENRMICYPCTLYP